MMSTTEIREKQAIADEIRQAVAEGRWPALSTSRGRMLNDACLNAVRRLNTMERIEQVAGMAELPAPDTLTAEEEALRPDATLFLLNRQYRAVG